MKAVKLLASFGLLVALSACSGGTASIAAGSPNPMTAPTTRPEKTWNVFRPMRVRSTGVRFEMGEIGAPFLDGHGGIWFRLGGYSTAGYLDGRGGLHYFPELSGWSVGQAFARDSYWELSESLDRNMTLYRVSVLRGLYESHPVRNPSLVGKGPSSRGFAMQADGTAWFIGDDTRTIVRLRDGRESTARLGVSDIENIVPIGDDVVASIWREGDVRQIPSGARRAFVEPIVLGGVLNTERSCDGVWFEGSHSFGRWSRRGGVRTLWKDRTASMLALAAPSCDAPWFAYPVLSRADAR